VRQDKILRRRLVGLGLFGVLLCVFGWGLIATLTAPHLRDRVDLWMFGVAFAVGVVVCLTALVITFKSMISRRP
jgi:multisubunit Na+/H+ antiporter MnhC subunit